MNVVIVGGGPAGAAMSYLFASRGVDVTLLERESDFDRVFRGEGLMPSGVDALSEMGLYEVLDQVPTRKLQSWDLVIEGRPIMSVPEPYEELGDRAMRIIPQTQFLETVIGKASEFPGFRFERGANARELLKERNRVAGVTAVKDGVAQEFPASLVIACDGRGSLLRTKAGIELKKMPGQYDVLWFKLPAPAELKERCSLMMMASTSGMAACYTSWDGRLQFALIQMKGERKEQSIEKWADDMGAPAPDWLKEHLRKVSSSIEGPNRLNVIAGRAEHWHAPGLLLLGDAAHPMSPIRAQGINLALRDCVIAANHLVGPLQRGDVDGMDAALTQIQVEREPEIKRSQLLQHRDTRGIGTWYAPLMIGLAKTIGPAMGKYRSAQNAWLDQQKDLRFGSTEVKLSC